MAEHLLDEMIKKMDAITSSLDGTIAQINNMSTAITQMSQKFSDETVSLTMFLKKNVNFVQFFVYYIHFRCDGC